MDANSILGYREMYEEHCDEIMDELFTDVEQSLRLHRERRRPEPQPSTEEPLVVSLVKVDVANTQVPILAEVVPSWVDPTPPIVIPPVAPPASSGVDKFFLGTALASMLIGAAVVLGHYFVVQRLLVQEPTPTPVATESKTPDRKTVEFASEIKTAFQTATPAQLSPANSSAPSASAPPAPEAPAPTPPQTVVQYVPVYSPPPVDPPSYREPAPEPVYTKPATTAKAPAVEPLPAPPSSSTTLSGTFMLEPNDRSYVLVETDGAVQSVPVGGVVGSTGWRLKTVDQNTAILEKDGQTRSVAVGQKF